LSNIFVFVFDYIVGIFQSLNYILYIPFGRTSDLQLNDLVFHREMKLEYRNEANAWYLQFYRKLRKMVANGDITEREKLLRLTKALGLSVLREKMPFWLVTAVQKTLTFDESNSNAVSKSWESVYFGPACSPGVLGKAIARREAEAANANAIEIAAATAAAATAAAGPGGMSAGIKAGVTAAKAAKEVHRAALLPLVAALAEEEIAVHAFDIPAINVSENMVGESLVQRKSKACVRFEVLRRVLQTQNLEHIDAVAYTQAPAPFSPQPR